MNLSISRLLICFLMLFGAVGNIDSRLSITGTMAYAGTNSNQIDVYSSRPSILTTTALPLILTPNSILTQSAWEALKRAQFAAAIEVLSLYPDRHIYFLGRDAEMIFDAAQLIAKPELRQRIHLINVSRANMTSPHLPEYLAGHGISNENLAQGMKVLFFDTGFAGTIPNEILTHFPKYAEQMKTHLIVSANPSHPSTRGFLIEINPAANEIDLANAHGTIVTYEHLPRYTDRSTEFRFIDGVWEAVSNPFGASDGEVSKEIATRFIQDMRFSFENNSNLRRFIRAHQLHWKRLQQILTKQTSPEVLKTSLTAFLNSESSLDASRRESIIRDLFEAEKNKSPLSLSLSNIPITDLGLTETIVAQESLKLKMAKKHPEWKALLTDPQKEVPKLVAANEFGTLGAVIDAVPDFEIKKFVIQELGKGEWTTKKRAMLYALLEKNEIEIDKLIATFGLGQRSISEIQSISKILIERKKTDVLVSLARTILDHSNFAELLNIFQDIIKISDHSTRNKISGSVVYGTLIYNEKLDLAYTLLNSGDQAIIEGIGSNAFNNDKVMDRKFWHRFIEVADQSALSKMAMQSFRDGNVEFKREFMRAVINKGDQEVLRSLLAYSFDDQKSLSWKKEIETIARKAEGETAKTMAKVFFGKPESSEHVRSLDILVRKNDKDIWNTLRVYAFKGDRAIAFKNQIRYIIQNADEEMLRRMGDVFINNLFADNRKLLALTTTDPEWIAMKNAVSILDRKERSRILYEPLQKKKQGALLSCKKFYE